MLECPLYIIDKFPSLFKNVVSGSLNLSFNWTAKWIYAYVSQRLPHSADLEN